MPIFSIRCNACGYERELILSSARYYNRISKVLKCDKCFETRWKKMPTSANVHFVGNGWGRKA